MIGSLRLKPGRLFEQGFKNIAGAANGDFLLGVELVGTIAPSTADKPAEMTAGKFISRAVVFHPAFFDLPAGFVSRLFVSYFAEKEKELSFDMRRNRTPSLLVAMNGFERDAEEICELLLCAEQLFSSLGEFYFVQDVHPYLAVSKDSWLGRLNDSVKGILC